MKKATLFAVACAMFVGAQSLAAQEPNEGVTYVSDPSQGVLLNRMQDNWFITAEGGANIYFGKHASVRNLSDRFAPAAGLYVGKWFSPVFGARVGANWLQLNGCSVGSGYLGALADEHMPEGKYYKTKVNEVGLAFDVMVNLTNWWCGYKPGRVYNASLYAGAGVDFSLDKDFHNLHDTQPYLRGGLLNSFNVSKQVALSLDIRWSGYDMASETGSQIRSDLAALIGITYKFKNREWVAPVVPVYPEPENCDELRAQLARANEKIDQLERALRDCLNRPMETTVVNAGPIATVYYPIGVSRLSAENRRVVKAVASQMNSDEYNGKSFNLTGWADNYTGTDAINIRLRAKRAEGVKNLLVRNGVDAGRLNIVENNGNRMGEGDQYVALDRCVTIEEAQ